MPGKPKIELTSEQKELLALGRKVLETADLAPPISKGKEKGSSGLACTCFGRMHPDPNCPNGCGRQLATEEVK